MELTDTGSLNLLTDAGAVIWSDAMMPNDLWTGPAENILKQGDTLNAQQFLRSENARFVAILKDDLSLVVYMRKEDGSNTEIYNNKLPSTGQNLGTLVVNAQGEVVVTDSTENKVLFTSPSKKSGSLYHLRMQNNGQLVTLDEKMEEQWSTDEATFAQEMEANIPSEVAAPFTSYRGFFLRSPSKKCMMSLNPDGALNIKDDTGKLYWQNNVDLSNDVGMYDRFVSFTEDGQFCLYLNEKTQNWIATDSKQDKTDGYKMSMTDDCKVQIKGASGDVTWNPFVMKKFIFTSATNVIKIGQSIGSNECLNDKTNMYAACMDPMGKLSVSLKMDTKGTAKEVWNSETTCEVADACIAKLESNVFEVYDTINKKSIKVISDKANTYIDMQVDRNFVGYDDSHTPLWAAGTQYSNNKDVESDAYPNTIVKSRKFYPGQIILASPDKKSMLTYSWKGDVGIHSGENYKTLSDTNLGDFKDNQQQYFILQGDGNLVLYQDAQSSSYKWATNKMSGHAIQMVDGGTFNVVDAEGSVIYTLSLNNSRFQKKQKKRVQSKKQKSL